jgi:hypothetical protein
MPLKDNWVNGEFVTASDVNAWAAALNDNEDRWQGAVTGLYYASEHGVGPDVVDNAGPLNSLINLVSNNGGGTIILPPGTLNVSSAVGRVAQLGYIALEGSGKQATTLRANGSGDFAVLFGDWRNCILRNMVIDANNGWYDAVRVHIDHCLLEELYVRNFTSKGLALNDGTYNAGNGNLNRIIRCDISNGESGTSAIAVHTTYRLTDTIFHANYFSCEGINVSTEGAGVWFTENHFNGLPLHNFVGRTSDLMVLLGNNFDHSMRESILWEIEGWVTDPVMQCSMQIVGNYFGNASYESPGTYDCVSMVATAAHRGRSFQFVGNQVEARGDTSFRHAVNIEYFDHVAISGNQWWMGRAEDEPVRAIGCTSIEVTGNGADNGSVGSSDAASATIPGFTVDPLGRQYSRYIENSFLNISASLPVGDKRAVVAEVTDSPGVITRLWSAVAAWSNTTRESFIEDEGIVRIYLDDDTTPAVEVPINQFFIYAARADSYWTQRHGHKRLSDKADNWRSVWMPYRHYMRVEVENQSSADTSAFYFGVDYRQTDDIGPYASYTMKSSKTTAAEQGDEVTIAEIAGSGQIEAITVAYDTDDADKYGFLEGNIQVFVDGEPSASITSSGVEDFFNGAFYDMPIGAYPAGRAGPSDLSGSHVCMYRFFPDDPISFASSVRVVAPAGQRTQSDDAFPTSVDVSGTVSAWLVSPTGVNYDRVDRGNSVVEDPMSYAAGTIPSAQFFQPDDRVQGAATGTSITFPDSTVSNADDMRVARTGLTLPGSGKYWAEARLRVNGTPTDAREIGLIVKGSNPDPYFGGSCHVTLQRSGRYEWAVFAKDGWNWVSRDVIGDGRDFTGEWLWVAAMVKGSHITAYYRYDESGRWRPFTSWTTSMTGNSIGICSFKGATECDQLNVYPTVRVESP